MFPKNIQQQCAVLTSRTIWASSHHSHTTHPPVNFTFYSHFPVRLVSEELPWTRQIITQHLQFFGTDFSPNASNSTLSGFISYICSCRRKLVWLCWSHLALLEPFFFPWSQWEKSLIHSMQHWECFHSLGCFSFVSPCLIWFASNVTMWQSLFTLWLMVMDYINELHFSWYFPTKTQLDFAGRFYSCG